MRNKVRRTTTFISLLLFPVTLNFFSPYVTIDGAMNGLIAGSLITFMFMFLTALFFGRAWCAYICPVAAIADVSETINNKNVNRKKLAYVRYTIFFIWFLFVIAAFIMAGGIKGIDPLHLTESGISVDEPLKYITYYLVVVLLLVLTLVLGKRGACHSICWMSSFLVAGSYLGRKMKLPQLKIRAEKEKCISCYRCNKACPMSIDVEEELKKGFISTYDCIICGACVDQCPKHVLRHSVDNAKVKTVKQTDISEKH